MNTVSFADLKLAPEILKALTEAGYTTPTPIQADGEIRDEAILRVIYRVLPARLDVFCP